ncbi:FGFR1 oncogene partner 2 isoform X2 [Chelonia mydas]|uniref:FGFR1 oncogene partner 2 isoform X2 n=1 Tax=Chelonia mydas TaxID=8469 RepID=UPI001CA9DBAA|nr:FGFR1 oncogene partner 2 isoform X2 [Chelonia mydas]
MKMSCTIEKALADAKALVERLREHDNAAEALIEQTTALNKRVEAMKQYQEEIQELNEVARHRPRSTLVMGIQQENRQIRELQQENKELRTSLEEHQSALELIMSKYREQMFRLLMASKKDDPGIITKLKEQHSKELQVHVDQITEMAAVMKRAIEIDEQQGCKEQERIFQLELHYSTTVKIPCCYPGVMNWEYACLVYDLCEIMKPIFVSGCKLSILKMRPFAFSVVCLPPCRVANSKGWWQNNNRG